MQPRLLALVLALPACVQSSDDATPQYAAPNCAPGYGMETVVACDFAPRIRPFATADGALFVVGESGTYWRVPFDGDKLRLFRDYFTGSAESRAATTIVHGGRLLYPGHIEVNGGYESGLVGVAADAPTPDGQPGAVQLGKPYDPTGPLVHDDARIYAGSIGHEDFSAFVGPVIAMSFDGATQTVVTAEPGEPIDIVDGVLWYRPDTTGHAVKRMVLADGPASAQEVTSGLTWDWAARAVTKDAIYATTEAAPYDIRRFGVDGANELVVHAFEGDAEIPLGAPHDLRLDGEWLYFMQDMGEHYSQLMRVRPGTQEAPQQVVMGQDLTPPVFDDNGIFVAYTRGGWEEPIEGVVVYIDDTSTAAAGSSK